VERPGRCADRKERLKRLLESRNVKIKLRPKAEHLVFVSHSSQDTWVAKQIAREIEAAGAKPFLDERRSTLVPISRKIYWLSWNGPTNLLCY